MEFILLGKGPSNIKEVVIEAEKYYRFEKESICLQLHNNYVQKILPSISFLSQKEL